MYYYSLRINISLDDQIESINNILMVESNFPPGWELKVIERDEDEPVFFIDYFLSILKGKYDQLQSIGITRDDISIWMLYEYEDQCNMEFSPKEMYELGKEGIVLCVSCWEK